MGIKCCMNCVAPKRHTACWGHCPEYIAEKEQYEKKKAQDDLKRKVRNDIYVNRADRVAKAMRHRGRK